jgi:hypothetical protein
MRLSLLGRGVQGELLTHVVKLEFISRELGCRRHLRKFFETIWQRLRFLCSRKESELDFLEGFDFVEDNHLGLDESTSGRFTLQVCNAALHYSYKLLIKWKQVPSSKKFKMSSKSSKAFIQKMQWSTSQPQIA